MIKTIKNGYLNPIQLYFKLENDKTRHFYEKIDEKIQIFKFWGEGRNTPFGTINLPPFHTRAIILHTEKSKKKKEDSSLKIIN